MITEIVFFIVGIILIGVALTEYDSKKTFHRVCKSLFTCVGLAMILLSIWSTVAFSPSIEICDTPGLIYSIDDSGNQQSYGASPATTVRHFKWDNHVYRYAYFCPGGGSGWNFTEISSDGEPITVYMKPFWDDKSGYPPLDNDKLKNLVSTYGMDWPQKILAPSEAYERNYIKTHTWKQILTNNNPDPFRYFEDDAYKNQPFDIWSSPREHLVDIAKESNFYDWQTYENLKPYAASVGVELERPTGLSETPTLTPLDNSKCHGKDECLESTSALIQHLKENK